MTHRSWILAAVLVFGYGLDSVSRAEALGKPKPPPEASASYVALGHDDLRCRFITWISGSCPSRGTSQACTSGEPERDCNAFIRSGLKFFAGAASGKPGARFYEPGGELEKYRFLTYVGHSRMSDWAVDKLRHFPLSRASFGGGKTRYLWFVSCSLFAHGPGPAFDQPELFGKSSDADVFSRWTKKSEPFRPFGQGLRLACGSSTLIDALPGAISPVLADLEHRGFSIADAFTHGLGAYAGYPPVTPICLTRSNHPDPEQTPLTDLAQTDTPNPASDQGFVFIQYPVRTRPAAIGSVLKNLFGEADANRIDRTPPSFEIREMPVLTFHRAPDPAGTTLRRHTPSGAFVLTSTAPATGSTAAERLVDLATQAGDASPLFAAAPPEEITLQVDRAAQADIDDGSHLTKITRMVRARIISRQLLVAYSPPTGGRRFVPVEGAGSGETLRYSPLGSGDAILSFWAPKAKAEPGAIRGVDEALALARAELEKSRLDGRRYELAGEPRWAYLQPPSDGDPERMYLYYRFDFRAAAGTAFLAPVTIEIPAHLAAGSRPPAAR